MACCNGFEEANTADENEQLDEILALQSIYEDGTFLCNLSDKPITGNISVTVETSEEQSITCNGDLITIRHLAPLTLSFSLPPDYPSASPPDVSLSCLWLTSQQLEKLSAKLIEQWTENCSVVLFTWIEFLRMEAIETLGIQFPIDVSEEALMKMTEHSVLREEEIFNRDFHFCPVCFLERPGKMCVRMPFCNHIFCKECLSEFLSLYIREGTMHSLVCPSEDCDEQVSPNIIKSLVSDSDFERYDRLLLQNTLDIMPDVGYCPRTKCLKPVVIDKKDRMGYCHACNFAFCTRCNMTYHGIDGCTWERDDVQQRFRLALKAGETKSPPSVMEEEVPQRKYKRSCKDGDKSEEFISLFTKPCPGCGANIQKTEGCNRMSCSKCRCIFCWCCLERLELYQYLSNHHASGNCSKKKSQLKRLMDAKRKHFIKAYASNSETELSNGHLDQSISTDTQTNDLSTGNQVVDEILEMEDLEPEEQNNRTESWVDSNTQKCPKCSISIQKWMGCNIMMCAKCGHRFCWLCLETFKRNSMIHHYITPSSPCFRKQYTPIHPSKVHNLP